MRRHTAVGLDFIHPVLSRMQISNRRVARPLYLDQYRLAGEIAVPGQLDRGHMGLGNVPGTGQGVRVFFFVRDTNGRAHKCAQKRMIHPREQIRGRSSIFMLLAHQRERHLGTDLPLLRAVAETPWIVSQYFPRGRT